MIYYLLLAPQALHGDAPKHLLPELCLRGTSGTRALATLTLWCPERDCPPSLSWLQFLPILSQADILPLSVDLFFKVSPNDTMSIKLFLRF